MSLAVFDILRFDTHRFVKQLISVGFSLEQAEVLAEAQVRVIQLFHNQLAIKDRLERLETAIQSGFAELKEEIIKVNSG